MRDKEGSKDRFIAELAKMEGSKMYDTDTGLWVRVYIDPLFELYWGELARIDDLAFKRGQRSKTRAKK